jgi:fructose-bisphosphate aldolase class II
MARQSNGHESAYVFLRLYSGGVGPKLRRSESLKKIKSAAKVFMTLHGGSGTDGKDFRKAIAAGINIIHINTGLRVAWRRGLEECLVKHPEEVVPYKILLYAVESVKQVTSARLRLVNNVEQFA